MLISYFALFHSNINNDIYGFNKNLSKLISEKYRTINHLYYLWRIGFSISGGVIAINVRVDFVVFTVLLPVLENQEPLQLIDPTAYTLKRESLQFPQCKAIKRMTGPLTSLHMSKKSHRHLNKTQSFLY